MVRQPLHLLGQTLSVGIFQSLDHPRVERMPTLREQRSIGDLVSQGVLKGVSDVGEARLAEELGGLEIREDTAERCLCDTAGEARSRRRGTARIDGSRRARRS